MKTKHIIATTSAAIIAGSIFYYLAKRSKRQLKELKAAPAITGAENKIRKVMHHAKETHNGY